jgi:hypothetical protein
MRAQHRQTAHEQARLMAAMAEVARCGVGPDNQLPRMAEPDEFAADEIRGALSWTRSAANTQLSLAWDLLDRLPQVFAALDAGSIDVPKARVFSDWTGGLTDEQAHHICDRLLPEAPALTTGQLVERVKRMAIAIDPEWARRKYEEAVRDRKVVGYRNEDGTANLCGYRLPADRAAAACAHIDELARKAKRAGDGRPIDHIRSDLYLAMLDGSFIGWSEADIITSLLGAATSPAGGRRDTAHAAGHSDGRDDVKRRCGQPGQPSTYSQEGRVRPGDPTGLGDPNPAQRNPYPQCSGGQGSGGGVAATARPDEAAEEAVGCGDPSGVGADDAPGTADRGHDPADVGTTRPVPPGKESSEETADGRGRNTGRERNVNDGARGHVIEEPWPIRSARDTAAESSGHEPTPSSSTPSGPLLRRAGVEIRVEVTTLLGLDDHPAEMAGWGPVHAELARRLVRDQTAAEWRYAITDDDGRLLTEGISRRRPAGYPTRAESPSRGGIVELQVPLAILHGLAACPARCDGWADLVADLTRQADRQQRDGRHERDGRDKRDGVLGRSPGRPMRRRTQIRDRTCVHPGCRTPASGTDGDHTNDWAHGGATEDRNLGSLCRHDHRLRHEGGWQLRQPAPGYFVWTSRLGIHYRVPPPLIIQPLPDPIPRDPPPAYQPDDQDNQVTEPIWWEPPRPSAETKRPPPPPDPGAPVPF